MNAKDDPRKMGTVPPVIKWKRRVPSPAVSREVLGLRPVR